MRVVGVLLTLICLSGCTTEQMRCFDSGKEVECKSVLPSPTPTADGKANQPQAKAIAPVAVVLPHMTKEWSQALVEKLKVAKPKLDKASNDMTRFCPKYKTLDSDAQLIAWAHLTAAVIYYESGVDSKGLIKTCSQMTETSGDNSIGMFQLSYGDLHCPAKRAEGNLCNVDVNLSCGVAILGDYTARDHVVASGGYVASGNSKPLGAARYWSVAREPDIHPRISGSKKVQRPHNLKQIIDLTKKAPGCT